jgi:hypothetical protein
MKMTSTNKLLILNSVLLVIILVVLVLINFDKLENNSEENQDNTEEPVSEDYPEERFYPKQDSIKVDFDDLKNDTIPLPDEIIQAIATELEGYNWNNEFQDEDLFNIYHETVFADEFPSGKKLSKKLIVVVYSNHGRNMYHAARGRLSLFEFQKENQNWQLTRKYFAFGIGTEYGYEPLWCKLVHIGSNNKYALIVQTNYSGIGGHEMENQSVYAEVGCSFELVLDFINYEHYEDYPKDFEYTEGYSNMRIMKSNKEWFDIETQSEGNEWNDNAPGKPKRFVFNGEEYVEHL